MDLFWELPGFLQVVLGFIAFSLSIQLIVLLAQVAFNIFCFVIGVIIALPFVIVFLIGLFVYERTLGRFLKSSNHQSSEESESYSDNEYAQGDDYSNFHQNSSSSEGSSDNSYQKQSSKNGVLCPYQVLGVERGASKSQIRTAYRKKLISNHPDRVQDMDPELIKIASDRIIVINEAYQKLGSI